MPVKNQKTSMEGPPVRQLGVHGRDGRVQQLHAARRPLACATPAEPAGGHDLTLAGLHEQVVALGVDEPVDLVLPAHGPGAAAAGQLAAGRRVDGDGEHVGRLGEVGDEAAVHDEVDEHPEVEDEGGEEDQKEAAVSRARATRAVLLRSDGGVEVLLLGNGDCRRGVILLFLLC